MEGALVDNTDGSQSLDRSVQIDYRKDCTWVVGMSPERIASLRRD